MKFIFIAIFLSVASVDVFSAEDFTIEIEGDAAWGLSDRADVTYKAANPACLQLNEVQGTLERKTKSAPLAFSDTTLLIPYLSPGSCLYQIDRAYMEIENENEHSFPIILRHRKYSGNSVKIRCKEVESPGEIELKCNHDKIIYFDFGSYAPKKIMIEMEN